MTNKLFTSINISRMPTIYWAITKSRKTKQWFAMFMMDAIRTITTRPFNIPGVFMEINRDRKITYYAV